jgi:hypothetical protein
MVLCHNAENSVPQSTLRPHNTSKVTKCAMDAGTPSKNKKYGTKVKGQRHQMLPFNFSNTLQPMRDLVTGSHCTNGGVHF